MPGIVVKVDAKAITKTLNDLEKKQLPFAMALAVNDLAFQVQAAERSAMTAVFNHPRPFTVNSTQVNRATKATLTASVFVRPEVEKYLLPYEQGGVHVLPGKGNTLLNPKNVTLDQYGQLPKNKLNQLAARSNVFIGPVTFKKTGKTISGFWQRPAKGVRRSGGKGTKGALGAIDSIKSGLKLLIRFGNALPVHKRLNFRERAIALIGAKAPQALANAMAKALRTAK